MRNWMLIGLSLLCFHPAGLLAQDAGIYWHQSLDQARTQAERDGRPILVFVTYSGHRDEDVRLRSEVFSDPEFVRFSRNHLVLMEVDFSPSGSASVEKRQAQRRLAQNLKVTTFPTLVLIDGKAGKMTRIDHVDQTAESLIREVKRTYTGG
jgi:hypothetical protein